MQHGDTDVLDHKEDSHGNHDHQKDHPAKEVEVKVNKKSVTMTMGKHTGYEIKQAAIEQGVKIDLNFVLSVITGHKRTAIITDDKEIQIHKGLCFTAVADDDNS